MQISEIECTLNGFYRRGFWALCAIFLKITQAEVLSRGFNARSTPVSVFQWH